MSEPTTEAGRALDTFRLHGPECPRSALVRRGQCTCGWTSRIVDCEAEARAPSLPLDEKGERRLAAALHAAKVGCQRGWTCNSVWLLRGHRDDARAIFAALRGEP